MCHLLCHSGRNSSSCPWRRPPASCCGAHSLICMWLVASWLDSGCIFLAGVLWRRCWVLFFLSNRVAWLWSVGEACLDHLIKVEWPKLLPCQVTLFLLVYNKYFMGGYFKTVWTRCFSNNFRSLVFACTVFSLNYLLPWWLPSGCFLILSFIVGKKAFSLPIYIKEDTCIPSLFKEIYYFTVIILILKLSSVWSVEAPSRRFLCVF